MHLGLPPVPEPPDRLSGSEPTLAVYREYSPHAALRPFVACAWSVTASLGSCGHCERVVPDGSIDIVAVRGELLIVGPATQPVHVAMAPGERIVGIRFRPGAARPLVGVSAKELLDVRLKLAAVWRGVGTQAAEVLAEASDTLEGIAVLEALLLRRLASAPGPDAVVVAAVDLLSEDPARPIVEIAAAAGLSERQLRRRFDDAVGYGPKTLALVLRLQRFLTIAGNAPPGVQNLALLAVDAGYSDQQHLTHDCKRLAGLPPLTLLREGRGVVRFLQDRSSAACSYPSR